jgi:hypothetical protein
MIAMKMRVAAMAAFSAIALLGGCATQPMAPSIPAMPPSGKSQQAFEQDEDYCEQYAGDRASGKVKEANDEELKRGVVGAALGAGIGALAGNTKGALIGGGLGAVLGSASGAGYDQHRVQRVYDIAYAQCMKARGNEVGFRRRPHWRRDYYPPPPPPPGY